MDGKIRLFIPQNFYICLGSFARIGFDVSFLCRIKSRELHRFLALKRGRQNIKGKLLAGFQFGNGLEGGRRKELNGCR